MLCAYADLHAIIVREHADTSSKQRSAHHAHMTEQEREREGGLEERTEGEKGDWREGERERRTHALTQHTPTPTRVPIQRQYKHEYQMTNEHAEHYVQQLKHCAHKGFYSSRPPNTANTMV